MSDGEHKRPWLIRWAPMIAIVISVGSAGLSLWSLNTSRDTARRSLRAYLNVTGARFGPLVPRQGMPVQYQISNIGRTPAHRVRQYLYFDFLPKSPTRASHPKWSSGKSYTYLGKGPLTSTFESRGFTADMIERMKSGKGERLYLVGRIFYEDTYRITRCLDFCLVYQGGDAGTRFAFCPTFNDADYGDCDEPGSTK